MVVLLFCAMAETKAEADLSKSPTLSAEAPRA
jgi:hypothetical protein